MKLLQAEVDANPAASPTMQPNVQGGIVMNAGVTVLDLVNASESENNFWVWVRAARPEDAWLEKHVSIESLGSVQGVQDVKENGKHKAYVRGRDSRRLTIKVTLPAQSPCRAGVYDMVASVQSQVPQRVNGEERALFEFPFRVAVRPFYRWSVGIEPEQVRVRLLRRKAVLWATVENAGNDWLYVDLKLPKESGQLTFERDVERIAVPPAQGGKASTRRVPIGLRSGFRGIRGSVVRVPVPLAATRVDAPTVPRFPSSADIVVSSLSLSSPVLMEPTTESKTASGAEVAYFPPIPATLTDFVTSLRTSLMALVSLFLMCAAAFYAFTFIYESTSHKYERSQTKLFCEKGEECERIPLGGTVILRGPHLAGSEVEVTDKEKRVLNSTTVESGGELKVTIPNQDVPPDTEATITVHRKAWGFLSWPPIFGSLPMTIRLGQAPVVKKETKEMELSVKTTVSLGDEVAIGPRGGQRFGMKKGTVLLNLSPIEAQWTDTKITIMIPSGDPKLAGAGVPLSVRLADGSAEGETKLTIVDPNAPAPNAPVAVDPNSVVPPGPGDEAKPGEKPASPVPDPKEPPKTHEATKEEQDVLQAVEAGSRDALATAVSAAVDAQDPHARQMKMYYAAVAGNRETYESLLDEFKKTKLPAEDAMGRALLGIAKAQWAATQGDAEQAHARLKTIRIELAGKGVKLGLLDAADRAITKGW